MLCGVTGGRTYDQVLVRELYIMTEKEMNIGYQNEHLQTVIKNNNNYNKKKK